MTRPTSLLAIPALLLLWLSHTAEAAPAARSIRPAPAFAQDDARQAVVREMLARSARATFNAHSAELALGALSGELDPNLRPTALFALGASGERTMSPRLESWAIEGSPADRRAALLGFAEGGFAPVELLVRLAHVNQSEVREAALLALARTGGERARSALTKFCEPESPEHSAALLARAFAVDPLSTPDWATGRAWLDLRWDAARRYGLVDGEPWRAHLVSELCADSAFLDAVIYGAASDLNRPGIADHFLEVALRAGPPERLRPVVNAIPTELNRMVEASVWFPSSQEEWAQLLYEIDDRRLDSLTMDILRKARAFPDLSAYASVLLVRAGNFEGLSMLELDIASPDAEKRERIAETLGGTHEPHYIDLLETLRIDENPRVRTAAMVAQMRLGNSLSVETVRGTLSGEAGPERAALVEGLSRLVYLPEISAMLQEYFDGYSDDEKLAVAIALAREGRVRQIVALRDRTDERVLRSPRGEHFVQGLVRIGTNAEVSTLFNMFPLEDCRGVNGEIALAMCARRVPDVLPILRSALWQGPFERSVLAGALLIQVDGVGALRIELDRPPKGARPEDIRRVGYALGEWGGTTEVERLGRRRTAADPAVQGALLGALGARTH